MRLHSATLLLSVSAFAAGSINDNAGEANSAQTAPTSNLISLRHSLAFQALQLLHQERISARHLVSSYDHDGSRELKPDSTKSAKNGSKSAKSKSSKAQSGCETYEAELVALKEEMAQPKWLFVQVGDKCVLDMSGDTPTIESANFHGDTELFTDRPFKLEKTASTKDWFTNFNEMFNDELGWPNTAMTFVNDDESVGVVVSAFVNGYTKDESDQTIYGYELNQSEEHEKVKSLEEILGGKDKMEFDHCSFFIDDDDWGEDVLHYFTG